MTDNSINYDNLQERNQQVLNNISQLQSQEKALYDSLDDVTLSSEQKQQIINKINEISQMRLNMYASMKDMYSFYQKDVAASRSSLGQEVSALDVMENELNEAKRRLNLIEDQKLNKLRLVEINTYYGKRYSAHSKIMKTIVIICVPLIILAILGNTGILPSNIYMFLVGIVVIIGIVIIGYQLIDISNRDNMNWDEYNWYFDKSKAPTDTSAYDSTSSSSPWTMPSMTCVGSECCYEGSTYDSDKNICVPNVVYQQEHPVDTTSTTTTSSGTTESFKGLDKYAYTQTKATPLYGNIMPTFASLTNF